MAEHPPTAVEGDNDGDVGILRAQRLIHPGAKRRGGPRDADVGGHHTGGAPAVEVVGEAAGRVLVAKRLPLVLGQLVHWAGDPAQHSA
jgi:hypothetical protein